MGEQIAQSAFSQPHRDDVALEREVPLRHSLLWQLQTAVFSQLGIAAWTTKGVPSYMSGNPFTAHQYAQLVLGYLRDLANSSSWDKHEPLYLFDLGVGTGRFAYVFLHYFHRMVKALPFLADYKICYVMTDIVEQNLEFCRAHPRLQPYFDEGLLDLAYYQHDQIGPIELRLAKRSLSSATVANPVVLLGNYFFDTLPQDLLRFDQGKLYEGRISLVATSVDGVAPRLDDPHLLEKVRCHFDYHEVDEASYYTQAEASFSSLIEAYKTSLSGEPFLVPVGGLKALHYFGELSKGRLLLIAGDQGYVTKEQLRASQEPKISLHGSCSMAVNYELISRWFESRHGISLSASQSDPLFQTFIGLLSAKPSHYPELTLIHRDLFDAFDPRDYWRMATELLEEGEEEVPSLQLILKLLKLGRWDPMNFYAFFPAIRKQLAEATIYEKEELRRAIHGCWDVFYSIHPLEGEFVMNMGVLLYEMHYYADALGFLQRSLEITGDMARTYTNMAACYLALFNVDGAHRCFEKAKELGAGVSS